MWVDHMVDHFSTYIYQKRGFYYFSRRVPKEVQHCHAKQRIVLALNTRSRAKALRQSQVICQRLDEKWLPMRLDAMGLSHVLTKDVSKLAAPTLSEAVQTYLQLKGVGRPKTFHRAAMRNAQVIVDILGDRPITEYSTVDAGKVRDALIGRGLAVLSVRRSFTTIKAIINLTIAEHGLGEGCFVTVHNVDGQAISNSRGCNSARENVVEKNVGEGCVLFRGVV